MLLRTALVLLVFEALWAGGLELSHEVQVPTEVDIRGLALSDSGAAILWLARGDSVLLVTPDGDLKALRVPNMRPTSASWSQDTV
jgi:hypothetical protein